MPYFKYSAATTNPAIYAFKPSAQKMLTRCKNAVEAIQ